MDATTTTDRRPACNGSFAKKRVKCFYGTLVLCSSLVLLLNICAENSPFRQARNCYLLLSVLVFSISAKGDTIPGNIETRKVITGQFSEQGVNNIYEIVRVISRYEIDALNAFTLRDVLVNELNAFVVYNSREGSLLNFQGTGLRNIKILLNGVPMLPHSMDIQDVSQFPLNNIERIEILEGPASVMYGTHAVSTVINLIPFQFQSRTTEVFAKGTDVSLGDYNIEAGLGYRSGKNDFQIYAGRYLFTGLQGIDSGRVLQWKPKNQTFFNAQYRYRFYKGLEAYAFSNLYFDQVEDKGYPVNQSIRAYDHNYKTSRINFGGGISGKLTKYHTLDALFNFNRYNWYDEYFLRDLSTLESYPLNNNQVRDTFQYSYFFGRAVLSRHSDQNPVNYQLGVELNYQRDNFDKVKKGIYPDITEMAVFALISWQPTEQFGIKGGLRATNSSKFKTPVTPELRLKYHINKNVKVLGTYANAFRVPTFNELFANGPDLGYTLKGNLNLKAEVSNNFYASLMWHSQKLRLYSTFFVNNRKNGIELVSRENAVYVYRNEGKLRNLGTRISFESIGKNLWLKIGFATTGVNSLPGEVGAYYFSQELIAQFHIKLPGHWAIASYSKIQGKRRDERRNIKQELEFSVLTGFALSDLSLRKELPAIGLTVMGGLKNIFSNTTIFESISLIDENDLEIFDRKIPQSIDYGRRFFVTLTYRLKK
jgi:outer membrane receptor for ferrienterochelin and colicins